MKIVYFFRYLTEKSSGVHKKIASQVFCLKQLGFEASIIAITDKNQPQIGGEDMRVISMPRSLKSRFKLINILIREHFIIRRLWEIIQELDSDSILYMRFSYPFFSFLYLMKKKRKCKIVFEHQSIEPKENALKGNYLYILFDYIFGSSIRSYCNGIVGVTDEITRYEVRRSGDPRKPQVTIGNGIIVAEFPIKNSFSFNDYQLNLLCVANVSRFHGLDRLIQGMSEYKGDLKIYFHIVGTGSEIRSLENLISNLKITNQIIFHGFKTGKDIDILFNQCQIAVGSLGIHRKGLTMTSELKSREYCARGIPFIIACGDTDFPDDFPYILRLPADESPVDIDDVIRFAKTVYSDLSFSIKMREYAKKSLGWSFKMMKLKQFLESLR